MRRGRLAAMVAKQTGDYAPLVSPVYWSGSAQFQAASGNTIIGPLNGIAHVHHRRDAAAEESLQFRATTIGAGERGKGGHRQAGFTGIKTLVFDEVCESLVKIVDIDKQA